MSELLSFGFWEQVFSGGVRLAVPLGLAALGELIAERSGVLNLGVEGTMALGALGGVAGAALGGPTLGLLGGLLVGLVVGVLFAQLVVVARASEIVVGFALALGGVALSIYLYRASFETRPSFSPFKITEVPLVANVPLIGPVLFEQPLVVWLLPISAFLTWFLLCRTRLGLEIRACGDGPAAARARGVRVERVRARCVIAAGGLGGLGGAILSAGLVGEFSDTVVGGRGFLALALVIAAGWRPWGLLAVSVGIGSLQALQLRVQALDVSLPVELLAALPFAVTLIMLGTGLGARSAPRVLGRLAGGFA